MMLQQPLQCAQATQLLLTMDVQTPFTLCASCRPSLATYLIASAQHAGLGAQVHTHHIVLHRYIHMYIIHFLDLPRALDAAPRLQTAAAIVEGAGSRYWLASIKHSGSLVTLSGHMGFAAKNSINNTFTAGEPSASVCAFMFNTSHCIRAMQRLEVSMYCHQTCPNVMSIQISAPQPGAKCVTFFADGFLASMLWITTLLVSADAHHVLRI